MGVAYYIAVGWVGLLAGLGGVAILHALRRAEEAAKAAALGVYPGQVRWRPAANTLLVVRRVTWWPPRRLDPRELWVTWEEWPAAHGRAKPWDDEAPAELLVAATVPVVLMDPRAFHTPLVWVTEQHEQEERGNDLVWKLPRP